MTLKTKRRLDYYLGGGLLFLLRPWAVAMGRLVGRNHDLRIRGGLGFIKMRGGGSLVIALPALLGLRRKYPELSFTLITSQPVVEFAESLALFDRILIIDDSSFLKMVFSTLQLCFHCRGIDTIIDLEVHSRLTALVSLFTLARNRIGFCLQNGFSRPAIQTHQILFNPLTGSFHFYEEVTRLLGATPADPQACQAHLFRSLRIQPMAASSKKIAIGHGCSDFMKERLLDKGQWRAIFKQRLPANTIGEVFFLGTAPEFDSAEAIRQELSFLFPGLQFRNECGKRTLASSLRLLAESGEFWGIDSALLHYARALGLKCVSFWGPSAPAQRLKSIPGLQEEIFYRRVPCSPCVHGREEPPCGGNNYCMNFFGGIGPFSETLSLRPLPS